MTSAPKSIKVLITYNKYKQASDHQYIEAGTQKTWSSSHFRFKKNLVIIKLDGNYFSVEQLIGSVYFTVTIALLASWTLQQNFATM